MCSNYSLYCFSSNFLIVPTFYYFTLFKILFNPNKGITIFLTFSIYSLRINGDIPGKLGSVLFLKK
jgi:hypothetical protein